MDSVLSTQWRMLSQPPTVKPIPRGLDRMWLQAARLAGRVSRSSSHFMQQADLVIAKEKVYRGVSDRNLGNYAAALRHRFLLGRDTDADCRHAFTILREVAARTVGLRPYREQIAAALALNAGCVAEMATGEGKTLVATMPAVLAGWRGRGCHVITANDYLARRDAEAMKAIYGFCGLTVGCIDPEMGPLDRKQAYNAHVTYCTNKEVAADFLRDRLVNASAKGLPALILSKMVAGGADRIGRLVQRGLAHAIVDEADSVFIDDASTPLLISGDGPNQAHSQAYEQAARLAAGLDPSVDYRVARDQPTVSLTASGKQHLSEVAEPLGGLWRGARRREELVVQALVANAVYVRDKHYVLEDDKVVIVDEFTGRLMPDRTWRDGLHQAVEAKEGVPINLPKDTFARISFQRFFRLYRHLSGMSGTVSEAQAELWGIYRLPMIPIPTHRPCRRAVMPDRVFTTAAEKWQAVIAEIGDVHRTGRPILIGTGSIRESEHLSRRLIAAGMDHRLLNAVQHASEAQIIADAGQQGRITVSTNMAGRGTDIQLGPGIAERGGLHVIATERFSARRIDRQLSGRCARQGDPGSSQAFVSLEDDLIQKNRPIIAAALRRVHGRSDCEISSTFWRHLIGVIQRQAERASYHRRRDVLSADHWLDQHLGFAASDL
ncbi:prepilin peptidase [Desulfosarcina sp.]|uniref:preprotein translocase subunit SecA n=1 Tax=Desulfosarcina sp. TaxID=2027861 RepID=UPI00356A6FF7